MSYNPKTRTYKGRSHYGDYEEFQQFKQQVDDEIYRERHAPREWTLPDNSSFYGNRDEFFAYKDQWYADRKREQAEQRAESERRKQVGGTIKSVRAWFYAEVRQYSVPKWYDKGSIAAFIDSFKADCDRAWSDQDASTLQRSAEWWVAKIQEVHSDYLVEVERRKNEKAASQSSDTEVWYGQDGQINRKHIRGEHAGQHDFYDPDTRVSGSAGANAPRKKKWWPFG